MFWSPTCIITWCLQPMNWRLVLPLSHGLSLKKLCGWRLMTIHLMIDPFLCGPIKVKHYLLLLERPKRFLRLNDPPTHMHKHICGVGMDFMIQQFMGPQVDLHWFICSASFCVALTKNKNRTFVMYASDVRSYYASFRQKFYFSHLVYLFKKKQVQISK